MGVVGLDIISKRGERRKILPFEIRAKMYEDVIELGKQELKCKGIQRRIYEKHRKRLPISTIKDWINRKHNPFGKVNKFDEKPSPKLEYIIGTMFTDGYKYIGKKKSQHFLRLEVNDREFAEKFAECLTKVLGRKKPYKPFFDRKRKRWIVIGCSVLLFKFLNKSLEELKPHIEYSKETVASFLRALFDAEGCIYVKIKRGKRRRQLRLCNTNKELLIYAKYLLKEHFDIDATGPYLTTRRGSIIYSPNGKIAKTNKDEYYIYIRARSLLNFYKHIGFIIKRKQRDLIRAIQ
jgi:intein-encoded DNA endonuclease-like protein